MDVTMTTMVVAYTSFCDGHVTRFSSLRTSPRKVRMLPNHPVTPPSAFVGAAFTLSSMPFSRVSPGPPGPEGRRSDGCIWQAKRDSNPQPPVLETGALPVELLACALL